MSRRIALLTNPSSGRGRGVRTAAEAVPRFDATPSRLLDADYARSTGSRFLGSLPAERIIDGREMLLGQAVLQARIFALGAVESPLPDEARVVAAMRAALADGATGAGASDSLEES